MDPMNHSKPPHTFGHENCRDLCEKLNRELGRLNDARNREDIADHAINFAVTAWHLIDWVWATHERNDEYFAFKGEAKRASGGWKCLADFRDYIVGREPRLENCGLFANSAKHLVLDEKRWPNQSEVATIASAKGDVTLSDMFQGTVEWTPKIVVGQRHLDARVEFQVVLDFWTQFIHGETVER